MAEPGLPEGEGVDLGARVEEGDLEGALDDARRLPDELVQPLIDQGAVAFVVHVEPVRRPRRLAVEQNAVTHRAAGRRRTHDSVQVARLEPVDDPAVGGVGLAELSSAVHSPDRAHWFSGNHSGAP